MVRMLKMGALGVLLAAFVFASTPLEATIVAPVPMTKIADCGVIGFVDSTLDLDDGTGSTQCKVWFPFHSPGAYLVAGIEDLNAGDTVFVKGIVCDPCLTTCAAGAILKAQLSPCGPSKVKSR